MSSVLCHNKTLGVNSSFLDNHVLWAVCSTVVPFLEIRIGSAAKEWTINVEKKCLLNIHGLYFCIPWLGVAQLSTNFRGNLRKRKNLNELKAIKHRSFNTYMSIITSGTLHYSLQCFKLKVFQSCYSLGNSKMIAKNKILEDSAGNRMS